MKNKSINLFKIGALCLTLLLFCTAFTSPITQPNSYVRQIGLFAATDIYHISLCQTLVDTGLSPSRMVTMGYGTGDTTFVGPIYRLINYSTTFVGSVMYIPTNTTHTTCQIAVYVSIVTKPL